MLGFPWTATRPHSSCIQTNINRRARSPVDLPTRRTGWNLHCHQAESTESIQQSALQITWRALPTTLASFVAISVSYTQALGRLALFG